MPPLRPHLAAAAKASAGSTRARLWHGVAAPPGQERPARDIGHPQPG